MKSQNDVWVLVRDAEKLKAHIGQDAQVEIILLSDMDWKKKVGTANADIVIHLAAYLTSVDDEDAITKLIDSNISFGTHLLDALKSTSLKLFINTGTFAEYLYNPNQLVPAYLYAATKTAFRSIVEYYRNLQHFKVINVIPYTIYGAQDTKKKLIDYIYSSLEFREPVRMSPGEQVLDFIHINDIVDFYISAINAADKLYDEYYEVHLGTTEGTTPKEVAGVLEEITGKKTNITWGAIPYRKTDTMYSVAPAYSLHEIEWKPKINLQTGLTLYTKSLYNQWN